MDTQLTKEAVLAKYLDVEIEDVTPTDIKTIYRVDGSRYAVLDEDEMEDDIDNWKDNLIADMEDDLDKRYPGLSYCIDWDSYFGPIDYVDLDYAEFTVNDIPFYICEE